MTDSNTTPPKVSKPTTIRRAFIRILLVLLLLVLLAIVSVAALVGTAKGREWLVDNIAPVALEKANINLQVTAFSWPTLGQIEIDELIVLLADGTAINANTIQLSIDIAALKERHLLLEQLLVRELNVQLPLVDNEQKENKNIDESDNSQSLEDQIKQSFAQIKAIGSLDIVQLQLDRFQLSQASVDIESKPLLPPLSFELTAGVGQNNPQVNIEAAANLLQPESAEIELSLKGNPLENLSIALSAQEKGQGWVSQQLQLPVLADLNLQLLADIGVVDNQVNLLINQFTMPVQNYQLSLEGNTAINWIDNKYQWQDVIFKTNEQAHQLTGEYQSDTLRSDIVLDQFPIDFIALFVEVPVAGTLSADSSIQIAGSDSFEWQGDGNIVIDGSYQETPFSVDTEVNLNNNRLRLNNLNGEFFDALVSGNGEVDLASRESQLVFSMNNLNSTLLDALKLELPVQQQLTANINGELTGDYPTPLVSLNANVNGEFEGQIISSNIYTSINFKNGIDAPLIDINSFDLNWGEVQFTAKGDIDLANKIHSIHTELNNFSLAQIQALDTERLSQTIPALTPIHEALQMPELEGVQFIVESLQTELSAQFDQPQVNVQLTSESIVSEQVFEISGSVNFADGQLESPTISLTSVLGKLSLSESRYNLSSQTLESKITLDGVNTSDWLAWPLLADALTEEQITSLGQLPLNVAAQIELGGSVTEPIAAISLLGEGSYQGEPLVLNLTIQEASLSLLEGVDANIQWAESFALHLVGGFNLSGSSDIRLSINATPDEDLITLLGLPPQKNSELLVDALITGELSDFIVDSDIAYRTDLLLPVNGEEELLEWPLTINGAIKTDENNFNLSAFVEDKAQQTMALKSSLARGIVQQLIDAPDEIAISQLPLNIVADGQLSLAQLAMLINDDNHQIEGDIVTDIMINGTVEQPNINGSLALKNAGYRNPLMGLVITDADVNVKAEGQSVVVDNAVIRDQFGGISELTGSLDWGRLLNSNKSRNLPEPPINFLLTQNNSQLFERGDVEITLSSNINLRGDLEEMALNGEVDINQLAIFLDAIVQNTVAQIEITEPTDTAATSSSGPAPNIRLNVNINANQQTNLYGKGINTELRGGVSITGTANEPMVSGELQTVRGRFEVLGKVFDLQEGQIRIENESMLFNITGLHQARDDTEVTAYVSGNLETLTLQLQSNPSLPEDEIISRLLFGKTTGDITPFQAIRLAQALDQLRTGTTSAFDVVGNAREALGVDSLTVDETQTEEGETQLSVSIGKYINDKVYLELEPGFSEEDSLKSTIEIELSPSISLESFAGSGSGFGGIELIWKNDY